MTNSQVIRRWDAEATERTNNVATSICSPLNNARLRNLFASADVADAIEFYVEDTDEELFTFAKEGDDLAAWALLIRSLPQTEMFSRRNGSLNSVVDEDDVFQMIAEAFFDRLQSEETYGLFASRFLSDSRHTSNEAQRFSTDYTAPPMELSLVRRVMKDSEGDARAAFELYQSRSDAAHRMSEDRFFSLVDLLNPAGTVRLDAQDTTGTRSVAETVADPNASAALAAVLGESFDSEDVEAAWESLTDRQRDVVARRLGLFSGSVETASSIAESLGISQPAVSDAYRKATRKLNTVLSRRNATQVTEKVALRRTISTGRGRARSAATNVPADQKDARGSLHLRTGDQWTTVYAQPIPERVRFGVYRSNNEN